DIGDERCAQAIEQASKVGGCRDLAVVPGSQFLGGDHPWERTQRIIAYNSYLGDYGDTDSQSLRLTTNRDVHAIGESLSRARTIQLSELYRQIPGLERYDCIAFAGSVDSPGSTPLFTCRQLENRTTLTLFRVKTLL
ncbi:MAG TPA: hypothetical protein VMT89_05930, partial [Candidatus Acidoferrales bacterium]|nr:hypothetical protein [Candidatus Acidoferrales bacterium]